MTELAIRGNENAVVQVPAQRLPQPGQEAQASPLVKWVDELVRAEQIAQTLARTSFVPASLRGKPDDIAAAILAGLELGLQPMATLRSIDVIQGTPALRANAMRGLVQSHGHEVELLESTSEKCVMRGRRKDSAEWQIAAWDIQRATKLGVVSRNPEWRKQPQTMLVARATGEVCRLIASDVLYAMPYAAEELDGDTLPDGQAFATPRVTVEEVMGQAAVAEVPAIEAAPPTPMPDYARLAQGATDLDMWRQVWDEARSAGHLDDALKEKLAARGQELRDAASAAAPSDSCGWCGATDHFEDDCTQRAGDKFEYASTQAGAA